MPQAKQARRSFTDQFKHEAVQMMLDGHAAASVAENLVINNPNLLYRWKAGDAPSQWT
jgi:transposase